MDESFPHYISPRVSDIIVSKYGTGQQVSSPRSFSFSDQNLSFQELKSEYAKALNYIEILKLEKNNLKNTLKIAIDKKSEEVNSSFSRVSQMREKSVPTSSTSTQYSKKLIDLEQENLELKGQLNTSTAKISVLETENRALQDKLHEITRINQMNGQLQSDMVHLNAEKRIQELEEENKYLLNSTRSEEVQPGLQKYINYILSIIGNFDSTHFARSCFEERFSKDDLPCLAESKNYNALTLKAFKYITDLLININSTSPRGKPGTINTNVNIELLRKRSIDGQSQFADYSSNGESPTIPSYRTNNNIDDLPTAKSTFHKQSLAKATPKGNKEASISTSAYRNTTDTSKRTLSPRTEESKPNYGSYTKQIQSPEAKTSQFAGFSSSSKNALDKKDSRNNASLRFREAEHSAYYSPLNKTSESMRITSPGTQERSTQYTTRDPRENRSMMDTRSYPTEPQHRTNDSISYFSTYQAPASEYHSARQTYPETSQFPSYSRNTDGGQQYFSHHRPSENLSIHSTHRSQQYDNHVRPSSNYSYDGYPPSNTYADQVAPRNNAQSNQDSRVSAQFYNENASNNNALNQSLTKASPHKTPGKPDLRPLQQWQEDNKDKLKLDLGRITDRSGKLESPSRGSFGNVPTQSHYKDVIQKIASNEKGNITFSNSKAYLTAQDSGRESERPTFSEKPSHREVEKLSQRNSISGNATNQYSNIPDFQDFTRQRVPSTVSREDPGEIHSARSQTQQMPKSILKTDSKYQQRKDSHDPNNDSMLIRSSEVGGFTVKDYYQAPEIEGRDHRSNSKERLNLSSFSTGANQRSKTEADEDLRPQYQLNQDEVQAPNQGERSRRVSTSATLPRNDPIPSNRESRVDDREIQSATQIRAEDHFSQSQTAQSFRSAAKSAHEDQAIKTNRSGINNEINESKFSIKKAVSSPQQKPVPKAFTMRELQKEKDKEREKELNKERERQRQRLIEKERQEEEERKRKAKKTEYETYSIVFGKTDPYEKKEVSPDKFKITSIVDVPRKKRVETRPQIYDPIKGELSPSGPKPTLQVPDLSLSSNKSEEMKTPTEAKKIVIPPVQMSQVAQGESNN